MARKRTGEERSEEVIDDRPLPYQAILVCAIVIIIIGVLMAFGGSTSAGFVTSNRYGEFTGGRGINGVSAIAIGILIGILPAWVLLRRRGRRRGRA